MNTPDTPHGPSSEDEQDPTGMRELLASLPDPGPMPDHVMRDISSALAEEQRRRTHDEAGNVSPLVGRQKADSSDGSSTKSSGTVRWLRPLAAVGAAAAIGIGALAGYQALSGGDSAPVANPPADSSSAPGADNVLDRISISNSGRDYTRTGLSTQASYLTKAGKSTMAPSKGATNDNGAPSITSPEGLLSCMRSIIGFKVPERISADLGQYEGKPAVIVVVTDNGKSEAWVVSRTCHNSKGKIAGPTAVT